MARLVGRCVIGTCCFTAALSILWLLRLPSKLHRAGNSFAEPILASHSQVTSERRVRLGGNVPTIVSPIDTRSGTIRAHSSVRQFAFVSAANINALRRCYPSRINFDGFAPSEFTDKGVAAVSHYIPLLALAEPSGEPTNPWLDRYRRRRCRIHGHGRRQTHWLLDESTTPKRKPAKSSKRPRSRPSPVARKPKSKPRNWPSQKRAASKSRSTKRATDVRSRTPSRQAGRHAQSASDQLQKQEKMVENNQRQAEPRKSKTPPAGKRTRRPAECRTANASTSSAASAPKTPKTASQSGSTKN